MIAVLLPAPVLPGCISTGCAAHQAPLYRDWLKGMLFGYLPWPLHKPVNNDKLI
jgi:hypothetical protein